MSDNKALYAGLIRTNPTNTKYGDSLFFNNVDRFLTPRIPYDNGVTNESKIQLQNKYSSLPAYTVNQSDARDAMYLQNIYDPSNFDVNVGYHQSVYGSQAAQWRRLDEAVNSNKIYNIYGFDLETIGVSDSNKLSDTSVITEIGITKSKMRGRVEKDFDSYSIALGIDSNKQVEKYLDDIKFIRDTGSGALKRKSERSLIESNIERLSRYSGEITDLYDLRNITNIGKDITVINRLAPSTGARTDKALEGLFNESILGGIQAQEMEQSLKSRGLYTDDLMQDYIRRQQLFQQRGYSIQTQSSKLIDKAKQVINKGVTGPKNFSLGFNTTAYDIPILNQIGNIKKNRIDQSAIMDVYSAFSMSAGGQDLLVAEKIARQNKVDINYPGKVRQEGLARAFGETFDDAAHNAASDTHVANKLSLNVLELMRNADGQIPDVQVKGVDIFGENTVAFALDSIMYDKNGLDALTVNGKTSEYYVSGVKRNRFYNISKVSQDEDGRFIARFTSAGSNTNEIFDKSYNSLEEMVQSIKSTFVFRDKSTFGDDPQKIIDAQDSIYRADIARRNYDKLFDISSIESTNKGEFVGGYDRLNQYYQAYKETLFEDGRRALEPRDFEKLADGAERNEEKLRKILIDNGLGYEKNGQSMISDSVVEDFKQFYGKLDDESSLLGFLEEEFQKPEYKNLNNYQKTLIANDVRNSIVDKSKVTNIYRELSDSEITKGKGALLAGEQDLYRFELSGKVYENAKDMFTTSINFENKENATKHLYNSIMREVGSQNAANKEVAASLLMNNIVTDLHDRKFVSDEFFRNFSNDVARNSANNYQPWRMAESIVSEIQTQYVFPMMDAGWSLEKLKDTAVKDKKLFVGTGEGQISEKLYDMTMSKMSDYSGSYLTKARNTRFERNGTVFTLNNIIKFDNVDLESNFAESYNRASKLNIDLSQDSVDQIRNITKNLMGYDDETADTISRMIGMKDFGMATKGWDSGTKRTDWITHFFQTGEAGDNGFALFVPTENGSATSGRIIKQLNAATRDTYRDVIESIKENGDAFVIELPAAKSMDFLDESNERTKVFKGYDSAGKPIYETPKYKSMTYGKGNFQQVVRQTTNSYFTPGQAHTVANFEIKPTDDMTSVAEAYRVMRNTLDDIAQNEDLTSKERMTQMTRRFSKYQNNVMLEMASLNGNMNAIEFLDETGNRVVKKMSIPTMGDMLASSRINLSSVQELFIRTVAEATSPKNIGTATEKDKAMARFIAQFTNDTRKNISDGEKLINVIERMESQHGKGTMISQQFQEVYIKHFMNLGLDEGKGYDSFGLTGTIIDYLEESKGRFSKSAANMVDMIYVNSKENRASQLLKGHDLEKNMISFLNEGEWIPNATMDSTMRPTTLAQNAAESFVKDLFVQDLGEDTMKVYGIHLGNDAEPLQEAIVRRTIANQEIGNGLKMGDLTQGFSANFRNMSAVDAITRMQEVKNGFAEVFKADLETSDWRIARGISQYAITKDMNEKLLRESFDILVQGGLFNNYESKIAINPEVFNTVFGNTPYIKKGDFNGIIENSRDLQEVAEFLKDKQLYDGYNITKAFRKETGRTISVSGLSADDVDLTYRGYSGVLSGTQEEIAAMLATQKAQVFNPIPDINDIKIQIGNEKGTGTNLAFLRSNFLKDNNNPYYKAQRMLYDYGIKDFDAQRDIILKYTGRAFQTTFGEGVAAVTASPFAKHINPTASNYLVELFGIANEELLSGNKQASVQFKDLFRSAAQSAIENRKYEKDFVGIVPELLDGKLVVNRNNLREAGEIPQIEEAIRIAIENKDENPLYSKIAESFTDPTKEKNQIYRQYIIRTPNNESLGHSVKLTERAGVSYRMKGIEEINEIVEYSKDAEYFNTFNINGERMTINDYIYRAMKDESFRDRGMERRSIENTISGLMYSLENRENPLTPNASNILEVKLEDLVEITGKRTPESMLDYGMFKMQGKDGNTLYSKQLERLAGKKDLNNVQALRVLLPDGITYDLDDTTKGLNAVLMPIMDVTPYKGELYLSDTARVMEDVVDIAKNFTREGTSNSQAMLNRAVNNMQVHFRNELLGDKHSYVAKRGTTIELKHAKRFFAKAATLPVVEGMVGENRDKWLNDADYREKLAKNIEKGIVDNSTRLAEESIIGNRTLSRVVNGKRVYDDIVFLSKQGYKNLGVDFVGSGTDIFYNFERYNRMSNLTTGKDIQNAMDFDAFNKTLDKLIDEENIMNRFHAKDMDKAREVVQHIVLGHDKYKKVNPNTVNKFRNFFEDVTTEYLSSIGTTGIIIREPAFHGGAIDSVMYKLDNTIGADEHIITSALMKRLNEDFDGDQDAVKLLMDLNGKLINDGDQRGEGNYLYRAWEQKYKQYMATGRNNQIMADLVRDQSDIIMKNGGVGVDLARDLSRKDVYSKAQNLQKLLTNDDITKMQLTLEGFKFSTLDEVTDLLKSNTTNKNGLYTTKNARQIQDIYDWYQLKNGNLLLNKMMQASTGKAYFTKAEIGNISNVNYHINEALESSMKEVLYGSSDIDKARLTKFQNIITDLHVENTGLLPITEQTAIDVKHLLGGMEVAQTPQYLIGMKQIFRNTTDPVQAQASMYSGLKNIYKALSNNDKVIPANMFFNGDQFANYILNTERNKIAADAGYLRGFRSIIDLSGELSKDQKTYISGAFGQTIDLLREEDDYFASVLRNKDFFDDTTLGQISKILNRPVDTFVNTFESKRSGIINELKEDMIYFYSNPDEEFISGSPLAYKGKRFNPKTGQYTLNFANPVDRKSKYSISGTEEEVRARLINEFGDFNAVTQAELNAIRNAERTGSGASNFVDKVATANARKYLDIKAQKELQGTVYGVNDYLSSVSSRTNQPYGFAQSKELLESIDASFEGKNAYIELRDNLRYIKYKDKKSTVVLEDALNELNQSIIENAKNKSTTTSVNNIYKDFLSRISGEDIIDNISNGSKDYLDYTSKFAKNLKDYFSQYDSTRIDITKATNELQALNKNNLANVQEKINDILLGYNVNNRQVYEGLDDVMSTIENKADINTLFNFDSDNLGAMRVGLDNNKSGNWLGRRFDTLSTEDIEQILIHPTKSTDSLQAYAAEETRNKLSEYLEYIKSNKVKKSRISGASTDDVKNILNMINQDIKTKAEGATERATAREAATEALKDTAKHDSGKYLDMKVMSDAWEATKDFMGKHGKTVAGVGLAMAAINIVSNILEPNDSPLSPELNSKPGYRGVGHGGKQAPKSPNETTVYANPADGLNYKMSGRSLQRINNMQAAQSISSGINGNTSISVHDDRTPVSDVWLQEKFSDLA